MRPSLVKLLKFGISAAIIGWLLYDAHRDRVFTDLANQPKDWTLLAVSFVLCFLAVALTMVRWHVLVRAMGLPFRLRDAFRLGFLGYLLNFVSLGSVGGDVFKAVFMARELPGRRAVAVATVVVDRIIGLYVLFVVASVAILTNGQLHSSSWEIRFTSQATLAAAIVGAAGIVALIVPGVTQGTLSDWLARLPHVGSVCGKLIAAVRLYRTRWRSVMAAALLSVLVHSLTTVGIYLIGRGLPGTAPTLADHFVVVPLAMVTGVLPLPLNGLGAFEAVVDFLYAHVGVSGGVTEARGFIVALGYRAITIVIALVGVGYFLAARREVRSILASAQEDGLPDHERKNQAQNGTAQKELATKDRAPKDLAATGPRDPSASHR